MKPSNDSVEYRTATIELSVFEKRLRLEVSAPTAPVSSDQLLPLFRSLADAFVSAEAESVEAAGAKISCRKGCGACCRQLVPISEPEARDLHKMVNDLPEPRRSEILARFEAARLRLKNAGLLETLLAPEKITDANLTPLGLDYFFKGIPCPFLEDESCSIHLDRPLACREYLVTSPAENCARPTAETVSCIKMPLKASLALSRMTTPEKDAPMKWVPLIVAPEWAETHPDESTERPGTEWVGEFFGILTGKDIPKAQPDSKKQGLMGT